MQNATTPNIDLKKNHVAISFHFVREAVAAGVLDPYWLKGEFNLSDIMTKQIPVVPFKTHVENMFWTPPHRRP